MFRQNFARAATQFLAADSDFQYGIFSISIGTTWAASGFPFNNTTNRNHPMQDSEMFIFEVPAIDEREKRSLQLSEQFIRDNCLNCPDECKANFSLSKITPI